MSSIRRKSALTAPSILDDQPSSPVAMRVCAGPPYSALKAAYFTVPISARAGLVGSSVFAGARTHEGTLLDPAVTILRALLDEIDGRLLMRKGSARADRKPRARAVARLVAPPPSREAVP